MIHLTEHPWLALALGTLATYRLALMISSESGPGRIFRKLRRLPEKGSATKEGLSCPLCLAIHFGALVAGFYWWREIIEPWDIPVWWLAMSAGAVCLHMQFTTDLHSK